MVRELPIHDVVQRLFTWLPLLAITLPVHAYSVLSHEAIIDSAWDQSIRPLLLKRFPNAAPADLIEAHAYAYGGCIIQDMGYYPFGSHLFSDILHYVRSGDFIMNEVALSQNLDEYAFALGSMAHYAADNEGHSIAVNPSVGDQYPKLERKYGPSVTYEENPTAHLRVEFGFDVLQVSKGNYAPKAYHDFIGFRTSQDLLNRAFLATYGLELKDVFSDLDLALGSYRRAVSTVIPEMTKVAWELDKKQLQKDHPGINERKFRYYLSRSSYEKEWGSGYQKPGAGAVIIAALFRIIPKIGPLKAWNPKPPTPETTKWFEKSFDQTLAMYTALLKQAGNGTLQLANMNFDTGKPTQPATYQLADEAYAKLAIDLAKNGAARSPKMTADIVTYFSDRDLAFATKKNKEEWRKTIEAVDKLRASLASASN